MKRVTSRRGNTYEILYGADICDATLSSKTKKYFDRLMEIDSDVFGGEDKGDDCVYVGDVSGYIDRFGYVEDTKRGQYRLDPTAGVVDNIVAVAKDDRILGYINYLTMDDELHNEIIHPDVEAYLADPARRDDGITGSQLRQWSKDKPNNLFILSVAVDKEYQDSDVIKVLTNSFREELVQKQKDGYDVTSISADTVSDHGEKFAKMIRCDIAEEHGKKVILPAPESDESGHDVTVRVCEGKNMELLLQKGFDFSHHDKTPGPLRTKSRRGFEFESLFAEPTKDLELNF